MPKHARDLKTVGKRELLGPTGLRSTSEHEWNEKIDHGFCKGNLEFCQQGYLQLVEKAFEGRDSCTTGVALERLERMGMVAVKATVGT